MMKMICIVLSVVLLLSVCTVEAEVNQRALAQAGRHLKSFRTQFYVGILIGVGTMLISNSLGGQFPWINGVGVAATYGFVLLAIYQAGKAGEQLEKAARG